MKQVDKDFLAAVESQDKEKIIVAIESGADLTVEDAGGMNALGIAAKYGNLGMADFLASEGVPVTNDAMIIAGMTEFDTTERMKVLLQAWQMRQMLPDTAGMKEADAALAVAAEQGDIAAMDKALANGAAIDSADGYDTTPLRWAIRKGHEAAAKHLLEQGADVHHVSENGWTPLMEAGASGEAEIVRVLLEGGADRAYTNPAGQTAESVTRYGGYDELAAYLIAPK